MICVLLVHGRPLIREGVALAKEYQPDVALIDIQMPVVDGIEVNRRIAADPALVGAHVVILTNYGLVEYACNALRADAVVLLVKDIQPEDFLHVPALTRKLIDRYVIQPSDRRDRVEGTSQP